MGLKLCQYYKQVYRRIYRLPVDPRTLNLLHTYTRAQFEVPLNKIQYQHNPINKKLYDKGIKILDNILIEDDYDSLEEVLDFVYKETQPQSQWILDFMKYKYLAFKPHWPQVHLFRELTKSPKHLALYEESLKNDKNEDLSLIEYFDIVPNANDIDLRPLKSMTKDTPSPITIITQEFKKLHSFLIRNQERLTHLKIQPMEVAYPTNRFALPIHVTKRDLMLKEKINYSKRLCEEFIPMKESSLENLIKFAIHKPGKNDVDPSYEINKNFYRYMIRKHKIERMELNPLKKKYVRTKNLIPNDNNIRKYMREYVRKQFSYDSKLGSYKMSWMQNFYENENRIVPNVELPQ